METGKNRGLTGIPFAEDLKRKDFIVVTHFSETQACAKDFIERFNNFSRVSAPYLKFIMKAAGLKL